MVPFYTPPPLHSTPLPLGHTQPFSSALRSRTGEKEASICVILCYLPVWQPASNAVSRSLLLFRRVCALYPLHSRAQLFSRGENRLQSTDYFESRSRPDDQNFLSPLSSLRLRNPCETTATSKVTRTSLPPRFEV